MIAHKNGMKIEQWFDVGCDCCGRHLSTDFNAGLQYSKDAAYIAAQKLGFRTVKTAHGTYTVCGYECRQQLLADQEKEDAVTALD